MFSIETVGSITFIKLSCARLDAANSTTFRQETEKTFEKGVHIVLNLEGVEFMDSTGIGAIIAFQRMIKAEGKELSICSPTSGVQTIFKLLRFNRIMKIFTNCEEAIKELSAQTAE